MVCRSSPSPAVNGGTRARVPAGHAPLPFASVPLVEPVELSDGRLVLRAPRADDVPAITAACQDPQLQRWTTVPVPYAERHAVEFVEYAQVGWASGSMPVWAVTLAGEDRYLGGFDLRLDRAGMAEVGFSVAAPARGRGVGTDALRLVCRWGFQALGLARIEWQAYVGNDASRRIAEKVGFRVEGSCRARLVQRGRRRDAWIGGLLPGELR